jgi:EpsI family protein
MLLAKLCFPCYASDMSRFSIPSSHAPFGPTDRNAFLLAGLLSACMLIALLAGFAIERLKPKPRNLADSIVGDWTVAPDIRSLVVNPETKELLQKIYSQILTRVYVNSDGRKLMLSIAYGNDQRGGLQAHKPEVCYPAQGFSLNTVSDSAIKTPYGPLSSRRLETVKGSRYEPVTYWFTMGDNRVLSTFDRRWVEIKSTLTGQIPDGLLFRVSSIDRNTAAAFKDHDQFVNQLLSSVRAQDRIRLTGLKPPTEQ